VCTERSIKIQGQLGRVAILLAIYQPSCLGIEAVQEPVDDRLAPGTSCRVAREKIV
jgi:hypothetical protein